MMINKKVYGIVIGTLGGLAGVLIALDLVPSFVTSPIFYGPLLGFLGGVLGIFVAIKKETSQPKKRKYAIMGGSILTVCMLFWIGVLIFIALK